MAKKIYPNSTGRILRLPAVIEFAGIGRTQLFEYVQRGEFPRPIKITESGRAVGWIEEELVEWLKSRVAARDSEGCRHDKE